MTNVAVLLFLSVVNGIECSPWLFGSLQRGTYPENIADLRSAKSQKYVIERLQSSAKDEPEQHQQLDTDRNPTNSPDKLVRKGSLLYDNLSATPDTSSMSLKPSYVAAFLGLLGQSSPKQKDESTASIASQYWQQKDMFKSQNEATKWTSSKFAKLNPANWFNREQDVDMLSFEKYEASSKNFDTSRNKGSTNSNEGSFFQKFFRYRSLSNLEDRPITSLLKTTTDSNIEDNLSTWPSTTVSETEDAEDALNISNGTDTKLSLEPGSIGVYILELLGGFATLIQGAIIQIANGGNAMKPNANPLDI